MKFKENDVVYLPRDLTKKDDRLGQYDESLLDQLVRVVSAFGDGSYSVTPLDRFLHDRFYIDVVFEDEILALSDIVPDSELDLNLRQDLKRRKVLAERSLENLELASEQLGRK